MLERALFEYFTLATPLVGPAFVPVGTPTLRPSVVLLVSSDSVATFELSIDGVNPFMFVNAQLTSSGALNLNLATNYVLLAAQTQFFVRTVSGAGGSIRITCVERAHENPI